MTKLEELARLIWRDSNDPTWGPAAIERELETALKPLLDALTQAKKAIHSLLNDGGEAQYSKAQAAIDEQLSQCRKK